MIKYRMRYMLHFIFSTILFLQCIKMPLNLVPLSNTHSCTRTHIHKQTILFAVVCVSCIFQLFCFVCFTLLSHSFILFSLYSVLFSLSIVWMLIIACVVVYALVLVTFSYHLFTAALTLINSMLYNTHGALHSRITECYAPERY